jgi:Tol biopolymer transport system component
MLRRFVTTSLLLAMVGALVSSVHAQPDERCFEETGFCISGRFREYWEQNGGLPVFGYPITAAQVEGVHGASVKHLTQYFERTRFELHPANPPPYDVLLGQLGNEQLLDQGVYWPNEPKGMPQQGCLWFAETQHSVCDQAPGRGFKSYWQSHGVEFDGCADCSFAESLALFGLPLTEPRMETNAAGTTMLVQWFERARFEWHPDQPDQYKVLLGLLGNQVSIGLKPIANPGVSGRLLVYADLLYEVQADGSQVRRLWPLSGEISPDQRQAATRCSTNGETGLCIVDIASGAQVRINADPSAVLGSWSPDGSRIAYVSSDGDRRGLHVINADGSGDVMLMRGTPGLMPSAPSWSPDGTQLVFNTVHSERALYVVNADGSDLRQIVAQGDSSHWSPTGNRIVFDASIAGNADIWAVDPDGANLTQLTTSPDSETRPRWSSDGARISYYWYGKVEPSPAGPPHGVYVMQADGSNQRRVFLNGPISRFSGLIWSPDGDYIAVNRFCIRLGCPGQVLGARVDGSQPFVMVENKRLGASASLVAWLR